MRTRPGQVIFNIKIPMGRNEKMENLESKIQSPGINIWFLKVTHSVFLMPYNLVKRPDNFQWKLRQLITAGLHGSALLYVLWISIFLPLVPSIDYVGGENQKGSMLKFVIILYWTWAIYVATLIYTLWGRRTYVAGLMAHFQKVQEIMKELEMPPMKRPLAVSINLLLIAVPLILTFIEIAGMDYELFSLDSSKLHDIFLDRASREFLFQPKLTEGIKSSWMVQVLAALRAVIITYVQALTHFGIYLLISLASSLYWVSSRFVAHFKGQQVSTEQILNTADALLELSEALHKGFGSLFTCYVLLFIPMHSLKLKQVFLDDEIEYGGAWIYPQIVIYISNFLVFLFISAEANDKFKTMIPIIRKVLLSTSNQAMDVSESLKFQQRLTVFTNEIQGNNFGVKGVGFTVTYGFVGGLAGLLITCTMILLQL